ncbi:right-handed parallel beta-helix repeat-containing protein [Mucilaginibacter terrigena]|uniref:Right-handed parallel beta-helix repeat-containing protein n=1 Tax=Mucilaginibacter terrigena TaxID=2492395 RepID=A0A4Q5LQ17_9SPHI|nr:right-handed parallel beta-helix repeat-containing protein [Mucilaginibacter terrigena]RYU91493.1 right-handed parallel beta-helix repeat-containing protein [Mucilaginibacter terrigena]
MKIYLLRGMAAMLVVSSFAMCTKTPNKIEKPVSTVTAQSPAVTTGEDEDIAADERQTVMDVSDPDYIVQPSQWYVDGTNIAPGSVVCIPAGTRGALLLKNFKGTADEPIIIVNKGGRVTFSTSITASYGFKTQNCQFFKILGTGAAGVKYGFDVNGGNIGMTMDDLSSDFEIANVEVRNSGFAGIMAKTDPSCDVATQRGRFTMRNIIIHKNYIHKTGGEGIYIGNSFYAEGITLACGRVLPHDIKTVKVYSNIIDSTGCEGIQVGSVISGCKVFNNTVKSPGLSPFASGQNNGIQIGEGSGGKCYNNMVKDAPGNGIIVLGLGDNLVYNNYIINAGAHGIFADSRYTPGPNFQFVNNTIISPGQDGIKLNSTIIPMNTVINNVIIDPGSGIAIHTMNSSVKLTAANNYISNDINTCGFVNYSADNYHLLSSSPLINAGVNVLSYGIVNDFFNTLRPAADDFDIGAAEYQEP